MADEDEEIETLTREVLEAVQRQLAFVLPPIIRKVKKAGARQAAERIARIAVDFPDQEESPLAAPGHLGKGGTPSERSPARGKVINELRTWLDEAASRGTTKRTLRDQAYAAGAKRSTFFYAVERLIKDNEAVEINGRLFGIRHAPSGLLPVKDTGTAAEAELPAEQEAAAPVHSQHEEGPLWNRPSA